MKLAVAGNSKKSTTLYHNVALYVHEYKEPKVPIFTCLKNKECMNKFK